ncbi:GNAT family N-acetyltransferase [Tenacibaculum singaporense]|uniref:GNAT family N-acetyltransferase n=1 Tax=Tenacibaculum singaporense TaxID=2358479 RepID=UPI000F67D9D0|nr:GNAT family N-acetyltransferase [Tenacibaculum singaporense]RSC92302.1 N-acetyltransferase [Tenacibaculum singaporense]
MSLFSPFPILHTQRLVLRKLIDSDKETLFKIRSNAIVNKFIDRQVPKSISEIEDFIKLIEKLVSKNEGIYWLIEHNNKVIGSIGLRHFNDDFSYAEVGYELHPDAHGKGFMSEALKKVLQFGFNSLNLNEIEAYTHKHNKDSINLLKRFNFQLRPDKKDNDFENNVIFGLLKNEQ